jgi:hypothetical protein
MSQAVKILDFGLAKIKSGELLRLVHPGTDYRPDGLALLHGARAVGRDDDPDSRSDIYSFGW